MARQSSTRIEGLEAKGIVVVDHQQDVEPITTTDLAETARSAAFMEEPVKVLVMATTDAQAPPYADINVNGERAVLRRNVPTYIKRKHLEVLARMKETRWIQQVPEGWNGAVGMDTLHGHTALAYPFTVLEDKNPRGGAWLEHILAEPA